MALDRSFILLEGDWPSARARHLLASLRARWVVVHRVHEGDDLYYAFEHAVTLGALAASAVEPVGVALNLHETDAVPTRAADTGSGDRVAVVVSGGLITGVATPGPAERIGGLESLVARRSEGSRAVRASAPPQVALGQVVSLVVELTVEGGSPGSVEALDPREPPSVAEGRAGAEPVLVARVGGGARDQTIRDLHRVAGAVAVEVVASVGGGSIAMAMPASGRFAIVGSLDREAEVTETGRVPVIGAVGDSIDDGSSGAASPVTEPGAAPVTAAVGDSIDGIGSPGDASPVTEPGAVPVTAAVGDSIDVVVQVTGGLEIVGSSGGELHVPGTGAPALLFKIDGRAIGPGEATVLVFQDGQCVGRIPVSIRVVPHVTELGPETATARIEPVAARPPDLQILVQERRSGDDVTYELRLSAADPALGLNLKLFGPFRFHQDPRSFFDDFYVDVEALLTSAASPKQKLQRLAAKGDSLFAALVPPAARADLWSLRPRIRSVHVQSEEPWIPWELIKLSGDDGSGVIVEGGFLCEDFEVTRWVPGLPYQRDLTLNDIGVVTPGDSGLAAAVPERNALFGLATPRRRVTGIAAEEVALRRALSAATHDAIHVTGHGIAAATSADRAELRLEQGSRLRPEDLTGVVANLGRRHPLVFLNACEIGRAGMGLASPGGWPRGFLAAGAGAFVGPFWKVLDGPAASFAGGFYRHLLGGMSVGRAALEARKQIQAASDPTWLAYSVYAHADACVAEAP